MEQNLTAMSEDIEAKYQQIEAHFASTYFTPSGIEELASMLNIIGSAEDLRQINELEFYDSERYNQAAKLLSKEKQAQLLKYAKQLNATDGNDRPRSYLERWRSYTGKTVQAIIDGAEGVISKIGKFIGLELVGDKCLAQIRINEEIQLFQTEQLKFDFTIEN